MTAVRLRLPAWESSIAPLADDVGGLVFGGVTGRVWQDREVARAGLRLDDADATRPLPENTTVAFAPGCLASAETLRALVDAARARGGVVQAAIRAGTPLWSALRRGRPIAGDLLLPLWAGALRGAVLQCDDDVVGAIPHAHAVAVCDDDGAVRVRVPPRGPPPHELALPDVVRFAAAPAHWLEVLEASLAALRVARRVAGAVEGRVVRARGKTSIHPTATVIDSILDDGVRIEAHASVIGCHLGADVLIADHSVVVDSVIGPASRTLVDTHLRRVVAMKGCTLSNLDMQDAIFGRDVFLTTGVAFFHPGPGRNVVVDGLDSGRAALGGAIGARCVLGSRALFAAGLALPPDALVVARPEEALGKVDDKGLGRAAMMRGDRSVDF